MTALTMKIHYEDFENNNAVPLTARGCALYTVDWFLNGKPVSVDHDNPHAVIQDCKRD